MRVEGLARAGEERKEEEEGYVPLLLPVAELVGELCGAQDSGWLKILTRARFAWEARFEETPDPKVVLA